MDIEAFPEIENFQKLPRQVIVKGGSSTFDPKIGAELRGIVINNIGNGVRNLRVHLVVFENKVIPVYNTSIEADPTSIPQGGIGSFAFQLKDYEKEITDYHLYTTWSFDHSE